MNKFGNKFLTYITIIIALFSVSCVEQLTDTTDAPDISAKSMPELMAGFENNQTKTYVENGKHMRWHEKDLISAFVGNTANSMYEFSGETGDNSGSFSFKKNVGENGTSLKCIYAAYPFDERNSMSKDGVMSLYLPETQTYLQGSFGMNSNAMVAATQDNNDTFLAFKNVCGYLKVMLYSNDEVVLKSVAISGNDGEKISGLANVEISKGSTPTVTMTNESEQTLVLDCGNGVRLGSSSENATELWLVIPPTKFSKGFTITAKDLLGRVFTKSTGKEVEIKRNEIQPMAALEADFKYLAPAVNEIWYTATEKVELYNKNGFIETVVSNDFDAETGKGVMTFDAPLSKIGYSAFYNKTSLKEIILPEGLLEIGSSAFSGCSSLSALTLPSTVTSISSTDAFKGCTGELIVNCNIPNQTSNAGIFLNSAFTKITFTDSVQSIGKYAFANCKTITEVVFPSDLENTGEYSFSGCTALKTISLGENVEEISLYAFKGCTALESISFPNTLKTIGNYAFNGCTSLSFVDWGNGVEEIGEYAFQKCTGLTVLNLPESLKKIKYSAFSSCSALAELHLPEGLESLAYSAFGWCEALVEVTIPQSVTSLSDGVFNRCNGIKRFKGKFATEDGLFLIKDNRMTDYAAGSDETVYDIPETVESIGSFFIYQSKAETIIFPSNLKEFNATFSECKKLRTLKCKALEPPRINSLPFNPFVVSSYTPRQILVPVESLDKYQAATGWSNWAIKSGYYTDNSTANVSSKTIRYEASEKVEPTICFAFGANYVSSTFDPTTGEGEIFFDGDITGVCDWAFLDNQSITAIYLPDSVQEVGYRAFYNCSNLKKISIPDSVKEIGEYAFYKSGLESIELPHGITTIGSSAFYGCKNLLTAVIPASVTKLGGSTFCYCENFKTLYCNAAVPPSGAGNLFAGVTSDYTIYVPLDSVNEYKTATYWKDYADRIVGKLTDDTPVGYTVKLNSHLTGSNDMYGWKVSSISNPSPSEYTIYESNNYRKHDTKSVMYIDINGLTSFEFYIRSNGESSYDYMMVSQLDQNITGYVSCQNETLVKAHTCDQANSGTELSDYKKVVFDNIDGKAHRITIVYKKDDEDHAGSDKGYVLIPKGDNENVEEETVGTYSLVLAPTTYGWRKSSSVSNPDAALYDGVYESTNTGVDSSYSTMYIDINGYKNFTVYIRSYAEDTYDYVMISELDKTITGSTSYSDSSLVKGHTRGSQTSSNLISGYKAIQFTDIDGGSHRITVVYRKDGSDYSGYDKGYVLIPYNQQ